jgi:hypothetical protein
VEVAGSNPVGTAGTAYALALERRGGGAASGAR